MTVQNRNSIFEHLDRRRWKFLEGTQGFSCVNLFGYFGEHKARYTSILLCFVWHSLVCKCSILLQVCGEKSHLLCTKLPICLPLDEHMKIEAQISFHSIINVG